MKHFQKWFDIIAGFSPEEEARLARAREIFFAESQSDFAALQTPACWRRARRVGQSRA